ncbi:L-histidine N(alpha)-methyltransferase [Nonomuraea sp. NPDC049421]|uniref:L-histidine N(alpha)-methyltransferase n=1 Tax=Nonomuraea sp. NPDC049421 TaxID=3155275 RepID=UPI00341AFB78
MGVEQHVVSPGEDFHRTYPAAQSNAIADAIEERGEFPYELTYLGDGGELWRAGEAQSGMETLPERYAGQLLALAPPSSPVRIVDLGPGTTRPVRGVIRHFLDASRLAGYRGIDISGEILEMAGEALRADFPSQRFVLCQGDFAGPDLARVLTDEPDEAVRLVVLAGGTAYNVPDPDRLLRHVRAAMNDQDVLLLTLRVDTGVDRPPFMDKVSVGGPYKPQQLMGLDLLGIDRSWYVTETGFGPVRSEVFVRVRFAEPVTVAFGARTASFEPGDRVLIWRYLYHDGAAVRDQLTRCGFRVRLFEHGDDRQMILVAATPSQDDPS